MYILIQMNLPTNDTHWGYVGYKHERTDPDNQKQGDTKMGFYIAQNESVSRRLNQWPKIPGWKDRVQSYMDKMHHLSDELAHLIARSLNLSADYFDESRDEGQEVLYLLHYPPRKSDPAEGLLGAGSHTDYDLVCIRTLIC